MLSAEEFAELRMLQAKAYGRDDALSSAEAARLRDLGRRHGEVEEEVFEPAPRAQPNPRIRPWIAALSVILVFALGVWLGWMLFGGPDTSSIGLSQDQRVRGADLVADGDYDANSMRAIAERAGVLVWLATSDDGGTLCLIVDDGSDATTACSDEDRVANDGLVVVHESVGDGFTDVAHATLLLTVEREPAVHLDVQRTEK